MTFGLIQNYELGRMDFLAGSNWVDSIIRGVGVSICFTVN